IGSLCFGIREVYCTWLAFFKSYSLRIPAGSGTRMRAVSSIIRFVQLLAIIPIGLGLSNAESFFELLNGLAQGQRWDFAEFARRLAAFSSPTGLGVAAILGLELLLRRGEVTHARSLRFPEKPWLWNRMWAERRIRLSNRTPIAICLAALGIFAFVIVP